MLDYLSGYESIAFQTKGSPLASTLVSIFQEVIDYRETIESATDRVKKIPLFFSQKSAPKLKAAINQYTGITCKKVELSKRMDCGYATILQFGDKIGINAENIISRYSGLEFDDFYAEYLKENNIHPVTVDEIKQVAESLNRETGKFNIDTMSNKIKCSMLLYFDPYSAFLIKECVHIELEYFTAVELTGIILHEIGHMVSALAHSADLCFRIQVYNRSLEYFTKTASLNEKVKLVKENIHILEPSLAVKAETALDTCTAAPGSMDRGSFIGTVLGWIIDTFIVALSVIFAIPYTILDVLSSIDSEMNPDAVLDSLNPDKRSDFYGLNKQEKLCEQFADEYVAKHGMSHGAIAGLRKIWNLSEYAQSFAMDFGHAKTSTIAYHLCKIPYIIITILYGDMTGGGGAYDMKLDRAQHLLNETCKSFKNKLSPEMADFFMHDYIELKKELNNRSAMDRLRQISEWVHQAIRYIAASLPAMLISGRFSAEYEKLYNQADKLISNPLFYQATRLESLLRKK